MIPRVHFERRGEELPTTLTDDELNRGESEAEGWWLTVQPSEQALARLRRLCRVNQSWGETEEYANGDWGSDVRIWWEHSRVWSVNFRFSAGADPYELLTEFVGIARDEQCLLLNLENGALLEPRDEIVAEQFRHSRAAHFLQDPEAALIAAAKSLRQC